MFHPTLFHLTFTPDNSYAYVAWFLSLYVISNSSTSLKLRLELNKTDFVLSSAKCILILLSTNQSQILLKSLVNFFFISVTFLYWKSRHESSACRYKSHSALGSYHWHKSKTVEDLKLNLAEHHMKFLRILKPDLQLLQ